MNSTEVPSHVRPMVSVVVITYQHAAYIEQCLEGILAQQADFPVEILLGDDGSTDGTRGLCRTYAQEHPDRIRFFQREQSDRDPKHPPGRDNLLALLKAAKGEYIARCDGDDYWNDPLKLKKQIDLLRAHQHAAGCFNLVQVREEPGGKLGRVYGAHEGRTSFSVEDTISPLSPCHPSGFVYRREALAQLPPWLGRVASADMPMFTLVADKGLLLILPEITGVYRKHSGGITETAAFKNALFHFHRINLWLYVDQHLHYRVHAKCVEVMRFHWRNIFIVCTPRTRLRHLFKLVLIHPGWFLLHPVFALARLRDCIRR